MQRQATKRPLTIKQMRDAFRAAIEHAGALIGESELLAAHGKHAGSFHRCVIALEELGKARVIHMHGAWVAGKKKVRWEPFWRAFYSHEEKLYHALMWANQSDVLSRASAEEVERAFLRLLDAARTLDIRKQSASYSGFDGESFDRPYDADHEAHAVALLHAAKDLFEQARSHPLMAAEGESEFREALLAGFRLAMSLDYGSAPTQEAFFERVAESNK